MSAMNSTDAGLIGEGERTGEITMEMCRREKFLVGKNLIGWIDAYSNSPGNLRSCWLGDKKRVVIFDFWDGDEELDQE